MTRAIINAFKKILAHDFKPVRQVFEQAAVDLLPHLNNVTHRAIICIASRFRLIHLSNAMLGSTTGITAPQCGAADDQPAAALGSGAPKSHAIPFPGRPHPLSVFKMTGFAVEPAAVKGLMCRCRTSAEMR